VKGIWLGPALGLIAVAWFALVVILILMRPGAENQRQIPSIGEALAERPRRGRLQAVSIVRRRP
jgi:hypothetical protein